MKKVIFGAIVAVGLATGSAYAYNNGFSSGGWHHGDSGQMIAMMGGGGNSMGGGSMGGYSMGGGSMGGYHGGGSGYMNHGGAWTGQDNWHSGRQQQFLDETADLRRQLNAKQYEYEEARRDPYYSRDKMLEIETDIRDINYKIGNIAERMRIGR